MNKKDQAFVKWMQGVSLSVRYIYWIIPVLLVPAAFVIYFTEGGNELQFVSILAFAGVLTWILRALMHYSIRTYAGAVKTIEESQKR